MSGAGSRVRRVPLLRTASGPPDPSQVRDALRSQPFKFNYLSVYEAEGRLADVVNRLSVLADEGGAEFVGFDLVLHRIPVPALDPTTIPARFHKRLATAGEDVELPHHMVSLFRLGGRTIAGPLFGSMLNQLLQDRSLSVAEACLYTLRRLHELLEEGVYDTLLIGMPYFDRWLRPDAWEPDAPRTFACLSLSRYCRSIWFEGPSPAPSNGRPRSTFFLLCADNALTDAILAPPLRGTLSSAQEILAELNHELAIEPPAEENDQIIRLMGRIARSAAAVEIRALLQGLLADEVPLQRFAERVDEHCRAGCFVWTPDAASDLRRAFQLDASGVDVRESSYHNPADESGAQRRKAEAVVCRYLVPPGASSGVSVMIAEDRYGGAALNPLMHTHPSPSMAILLDGSVVFETLVSDDWRHAEAADLAARDPSRCTVVRERLVPGAVLFFSAGMGHRFVPDEGTPFSLLVAQRGDVEVTDEQYSRPIPQQLTSALKVASQDVWARRYGFGFGFLNAST